MRPWTTALAVPAILFRLVGTASAQVDFLQEAELVSSAPAFNDRFGNSVSISGDTAIIGVPFDDEAGSNSGSAYVFVRSGTTWTQQQKLLAPDPGIDDHFGTSVSISGDTAVVGAPEDDPGFNSGSAYVFVRSGTTWTEQQKLTVTPGFNYHFGSSVSVSGDTAIIGVPSDDDAGSNTGAAHVFVRSGTVWTEQQKLGAGDASPGDEFGASLSISGDTVMIGARFDDDAGSNSGAAYVFVRSGTIWTQQQKLAASDAATFDEFGKSVGISGETSVVGAWGANGQEDDFGAAYVFVRSGTTWAEQQKLSANDAAAGDQFGISVATSGDTIVIGAAFDDDAVNLSGSAYVFERVDTTWTERQKLTANDAAAGDRFGASVATSGDTAVVGADFNDGAGFDTGSAYVFRLAASPFTVFCNASDGSLASCPCSNIGDPDSGCDNAQSTGGVRLQATSFVTATNDATLLGSGFPGQPTVIAIRSTALEPTPVVFGDGLRCVGVPVARVSVASASGGTSTHSLDHEAGPGAFHYQLWYRNQPTSFCDPAAAFNLSSGLSIAWP